VTLVLAEPLMAEKMDQNGIRGWAWQAEDSSTMVLPMARIKDLGSDGHDRTPRICCLPPPAMPFW
jgi:hypothetical protein